MGDLTGLPGWPRLEAQVDLRSAPPWMITLHDLVVKLRAEDDALVARGLLPPRVTPETLRAIAARAEFRLIEGGGGDGE